MTAVSFLTYVNETVVPDILKSIADRPESVTVAGAATATASWWAWKTAGERVADGSYLSEIGAAYGMLTAILNRLDETRDAEELLPLSWDEVQSAYCAIWERRSEYYDALLAREVERRNGIAM
jgi:hypothetical protein